MFVALDSNDNDATATQTINALKEKNIFEKLQTNGMTVTDLRGKVSFRKHVVLQKNISS